MPPTSRDVHGPCERCGVRFTSPAATARPRCPNCGHRDPCSAHGRQVAGAAASEAAASIVRVPVPADAGSRPGVRNGWPVN